ncbi:MAG: hypothetical protein M3Z22_00605 [Verrucomicrobiota bacterium]|nr:hypothetical protein [Verrucomicrobiota bacterium]
MKTKTLLIIAALAAALQCAPAGFAQKPDGATKTEKQARRAAFLKSLSPEERAKFRAARKAAMADPAVQSAKERARQTKSPEARKEFRQARRAAMLRADPSIQSIFDRMPAHRPRNS